MAEKAWKTEDVVVRKISSKKAKKVLTIGSRFGNIIERLLSGTQKQRVLKEKSEKPEKVLDKIGFQC